jgi:hypothetical protein
MNHEFDSNSDFFSDEEELVRFAEELPMPSRGTRDRILKSATKAYRRGQLVRRVQFASTVTAIFVAGVFLTGYYVSLLSDSVQSMTSRLHSQPAVSAPTLLDAKASHRARLLASFNQPDVWATVEASEAYRLHGLESIRAAFVD